MTEEIKARAEAASKQGTFNFLDRLANRGYATEKVDIYLDERAAHRLTALREKLQAATDATKAEVEAEVRAALDEVNASRYTITLTGISSEAYDEVVESAQKEFPLEFTETRHPLTMALERELVTNEDREQYFRTHLWAKFITSVEAPDGAVDDNITPEWVGAFLAHAPLSGVGRVALKINELRMLTDWMDEIQGPDFLAKF